jgi:methionine-rich copper-binding protein CopC
MRIRNRKLRFFAAITLSLLASGISTTSASANSLTSTTPISGAILNSAPSAVTLVTQSPLANMGSEITVSDPNGAKVDDGTLTIDGNSAVVGLLPLTEKGIYTVNYSLITDNDVPLTGSYTFTFNAPDKITTPAPTKTKDAAAKGSNNFGTTVFVLLVGVAGILVAFGLVFYGRKLYNER